MLRRTVSLLLAAILLLIAVPVMAEDALAEYIPVELDVYGNRIGMTRVKGLYREQVLYFPAEILCSLTGAEMTAASADSVTFRMHGGLRVFTVTESGVITERPYNREILSQTSAVSYDGILYLSAWDMLSYMGAVAEFGKNEYANVHLAVYMPYTVLDLCLEADRSNMYLFSWSEADGKIVDLEHLQGLAALDTVTFGYESNIINYANWNYADHIESTIYSDVLMEILYCNHVEEIAPENNLIGAIDATSTAVNLPMPWLQKVIELTVMDATDVEKRVAGHANYILGGAADLVNMTAEIAEEVSRMQQFFAMSNTLQNLLRGTFCRVQPGDGIYEMYPRLFLAAHDVDTIIQGKYTLEQRSLEEFLYTMGNFGLSLINGNVAAAAWSTLTSAISMDYEENELFSDERCITFASVSSDVGILAAKLLVKDWNELIAANFGFGEGDTELQEYLKLDIILCLKASLQARELLLETGWLSDDAQQVMEMRADDTAILLNKAENAAAVPLGVIEPLPCDISWIEELSLVDGLLVVHPLFQLSDGFVRKVEQQKDVPEGYVPIYSYEDFKVIAEFCPSDTARGFHEAFPLNEYNQAKYILMNDIVMPDEYDSAAVFAGVLDGNGYTMKNVSMPLFCRLDNATVKNLALEVDCTYTDQGRDMNLYHSADYEFGFISHNYYHGIWSESCIDNCSITGTVNLTGERIIYGNFVGGDYSTFLVDCYSNVNVHLQADVVYAGGICGNALNSRIYNCLNQGDITVTASEAGNQHYIGGITTIVMPDIDSCRNDGDIHVTFSGRATGCVGGIAAAQWIGTSPYGTINCCNSGDITVVASPNHMSIDSHTGGVLGCNQILQVENAAETSIRNCWNSGRITGPIAGGIVAVADACTSIEDCSNVGDIEGSKRSGGIAGYLSYTTSELARCVNAGDVKGDGKTGSLIGECYVGTITKSHATAYDCYVKDSELSLSNPTIDDTSVTRLDNASLSDPQKMDKLDFENLWIILDGLPVPLYHDRTVYKFDYTGGFIGPELGQQGDLFGRMGDDGWLAEYQNQEALYGMLSGNGGFAADVGQHAADAVEDAAAGDDPNGDAPAGESSAGTFDGEGFFAVHAFENVADPDANEVGSPNQQHPEGVADGAEVDEEGFSEVPVLEDVDAAFGASQNRNPAQQSPAGATDDAPVAESLSEVPVSSNPPAPADAFLDALLEVEAPVYPTIDFRRVSMSGGKKYSVYSAPSSSSWRGAENKAAVSTNGDIWAAGWDNGWLLIFYETSGGSVRVGYINGSKISGQVSVQNALDFARTPARMNERTALTDDIARAASTITTLTAGEEVTFLAIYHGEREWAYIETTYSKKTVRGFVPMDCLEMMSEP